ncbi:nephrocystin-3-like [Anneissia japonica]|uniref:nephrocystin-3-like n=1 Tax=Anneissia japonica TaxID=1529436 RepID=UPI00142599A9|nr:nephrocystin-3-like [Anneissia japonica]XP_033113806.1 nephrocystin-3-like [Anneissia japonica]
MGTGSSFVRGDAGEGGVVTRIPNEVKPRRTLLPSRGSLTLGRKGKGASMRSALSVELENTELDRLRRDFETYKYSKQTEVADLAKKEKKFESENRRLRAELQALQKTCNKLRVERDLACDSEYQAMVRANIFEQDRDKVQHNFKIFRETKESEIRDLLKSRRDLEVTLQNANVPHISVKTPSAQSTTDTNGDTSNVGDWWTALESEPSLGSTTQLQSLHLRGPEFAYNRGDNESPVININNGDWQGISHSMLTPFYQEVESRVITVYLSAPSNMQAEVDIFKMEYESELEHLCEMEGRFFLLVHFTVDNPKELTDDDLLKQHDIRQRQLQQATMFLAFLGGHTDRFTADEYSIAHLMNPGARPAVFCFRNPAYRNCKGHDSEASKLKELVHERGRCKIIGNYDDPNQGAKEAYRELTRLLRLELGLPMDEKNGGMLEHELQNSVSDDMCITWDAYNNADQLEVFELALVSTCELGFEKHYERLNDHVIAAGPLPPYLVCGPSGSGKSLLLAKWISLQQKHARSSLILYHFVGSMKSCSADAVNMIRRMTAQLLQYVSSPPPLTSDPARLLEEFPRWLERVSTKFPGGIILVIDSMEQLQDAESNMQWLLDPLPVDVRVIVSVSADARPQAWRSWPTLHLEPLTPKHVKELVRAECNIKNFSLSSEQQSRLLSHCRMPSTRLPLYIMVLIDELIHFNQTIIDLDQKLEVCLKYADTIELYRHVLETLEIEHEGVANRGLLKRIMQIICCSRNGIAESELFHLVPELTWLFWASLMYDLINRHVLNYRAGLIFFAHEQVNEAVQIRYCMGVHEKELASANQLLIDHFSNSLRPGYVTARVADELPWLIQQTGDMEKLKMCISDLFVFQLLYSRGCCGELITYWQNVGCDKNAMAMEYFNAIKKAEENLGGVFTLPRIADMYELLGRFLKDLGLLNQAVISLNRALEVRESIDPDHPSVAQCFYLLGGLHGQWGKFATAEAYFKQALDINGSAFSNEHESVVKVLESLAFLYRKQNKHDQAEPLQKRVAALKKKLQPFNVNSHGNINMLQKRALQLEELATGPDTPELAKTLNELGVLYYLQNKHSTSEAYFKRSLAMREATQGSDHPDIAQSLNNLASLYNDRKQFDMAEPLYERALKIRQKTLPEEHPAVAATIKNLATLYRKQGKFDLARPLYEQAVEIREKTFGEKHPSVGTALVNLAVLHCQQAKHGDALPLYERALKIYEDVFGQHHPQVAETLRNLAVLRYEQGEYQNAAQLYKRATEIKELDAMSFTSKSISGSSVARNSVLGHSTFFPDPR